MNKYLALLAFLGFVGCSAPGEPEQNGPAVAETYFFPQSTGLQYTYSHDDPNTSDTSTYRVIVDGNYGAYSRLEKFENGATVDGEALYYYKTSINRNGVLECVLAKQSNAGEDIIALQGELYIGSSWNANADGTIRATVEDHYESYYLVGRAKSYNDVVVIKYVDSRETEGTYILRYFANGYGLIHEKRVMIEDSGPNAEISNLRLINSTVNPSTISQRPNRWWDAQGRYIAPPPSSPEELD